MTPATEIRDGVLHALTELLQDDDILRDLYAAVALATLRIGGYGYAEPGAPQRAAIEAYGIAEEMLRARRLTHPKSRLPK